MGQINYLMSLIQGRTSHLHFKRRFIFDSADELIQYMNAMNSELFNDKFISYYDILWYLPRDTKDERRKYANSNVMFGWNSKDNWRTKKLRKGRYLLILPKPDYWLRNIWAIDLSHSKYFTAKGKESFENK